MKTPNLIKDSVKAKKALTAAQLTSWIKEFSDFSNAQIVPDKAIKETILSALQKKEKISNAVLANLSEGYKNFSILKLGKADFKNNYQLALNEKIKTSVVAIVTAQEIAETTFAEETLQRIFESHTKTVNGIEDFPISPDLIVFKAKMDFENGKKPAVLVKELSSSLAVNKADRKLSRALAHYALIDGNNALAKKTLDQIPIDPTSFHEMTLRKRLDPHNDFGGIGNPGGPDFPFPDHGNQGLPGFPDLDKPTKPGRGDIFPPGGRPFDEDPIGDLIADRNREENIPKPFTDTISVKFPENFYLYHYSLLNETKLEELKKYIATDSAVKGNPTHILNVLYNAHKNWSVALDELHKQRFSSALIKLNAAQDSALGILRCIFNTTKSENARLARVAERRNPVNGNKPTDPLLFDLQKVLEEYTKKNRPTSSPFSRKKDDRNAFIDLDSLHYMDWLEPISRYTPGQKPLKANVGTDEFLGESWFTKQTISDFNALTEDEKIAFRQRVSFFDFQLFCLAYIFIPFSKIEAYRFSKQYENALTEIDRLKTLDNQFKFLNQAMEKPFLAILQSQILIEKAEKEYKSGTVLKNLIDSTTNPKGLVAKTTYESAVLAFSDFPKYAEYVQKTIDDFPLTKNTGNRLDDRKANLMRAKEMRSLQIAATEANRLALVPKKDFPWKNQIKINLTNENGTCANPLIYSLIMQAKSRLLQIKNDFNYLGYKDNFLPPWKFSFLLDRARYYTDQTKNLQRDYLNFISNAEREELQEMSAGQALSMERMNVTIENARVDLSLNEVETAQESNELALLQIDNASKRKQNFDDYDKTADAADFVVGVYSVVSAIPAIAGAIAGGVAGTAVNPGVGSSVGAFMGASATGAGAITQLAQLFKESAQRDMEQKNLDLAISEATKAEDVSKEQLESAEQSLKIANLQAQSAMMRLEFAKDNYEYLRNRLTNAELWFRLAHQIREISNIYFRRAIEISFLAEQAYEFMVDKKVDVIRFDYDNDELGSMLGADYLKADLDYLENHLIVNQREKQQQVKCVISMARDFPQALQDLRENGQSLVPVTLAYLEKRFPGLYQMKVAAIEVQPFVITNPTRFNVELSFLGSGLLRTQTTPAYDDGSGENVINNFGGYGTPAWISNAETLFPVKTLLSSVETSIYSGLSASEESSYFQSFSAQQKAAFEDCPAAGGWMLDMSMTENEVVPGSMADMVLTFYLTGYYSTELKNEIENAVRTEETLVTNTFSAQREFPDALFDFQRSGKIGLPISPEMLALNKRIGKLNELSLRFIPSKIDVGFTRFSSISVSKFFCTKNVKLEVISETPQVFLEGKNMVLNITLSNVKNKEIVIFAQEDPSVQLSRNAASNDTHDFGKIEFKKQGKQIVIIRETTGGVLNDYSLEVFVSKNEKMILPTTTFTKTSIDSNKKLAFSMNQLKKKSNGSFDTVSYEKQDENAQCLVLDQDGKLLGETTTDKLSGFNVNISGQKEQNLYVIVLYTKKVTSSFQCNQDIKPFSNSTNNAPLRTNVKNHDAQNPLTPFAEHLFGADLKKVKSPVDNWQLAITPAQNPFLECYDCNGVKKLDATMFNDVILSMEYYLHP